MSLRLLPPAPICYCLPWHLHGIVRVPVFGARCCFCDAEIAAPEEVRGRHVACIYCGLSNGEIPLEDAPFDETFTGVEWPRNHAQCNVSPQADGMQRSMGEKP